MSRSGGIASPLQRAAGFLSAACFVFAGVCFGEGGDAALTVPENLRLVALTPNSLSVAADAVDAATGYAFGLARLAGCPLTACRENAAAAPALTEGWSFGQTNNVRLSAYSGDSSTFVDRETSDDRVSLKVEAKDAAEAVLVEILSPEAPAGERFGTVSCWCKRSSGDAADVLRVFGLPAGSEEWVPLSEPLDVPTTKSRPSFAVEPSLSVRRVKFVLSAAAGTFRNCALDSFCVTYGGEESREAVSAVTSAAPACVFADLPCARYGCRVRALGDSTAEPASADSDWSDEMTVDLAWADIVVSAPTGLVCEATGQRLDVTWKPVENAETYVVTLARAETPESVLATETVLKTSATFALDALGAYAVTVTAVSPGGVSRATAPAVVCELKLGPVTGLQALATQPDALVATWDAVPLAEGYRVTLFKIEGEDGVRREVASVDLAAGERRAAFADLDRQGVYEVAVVPLPDEKGEVEAAVARIDLAAQHFRTVGPVPLSDCTDGFLETFDSLAGLEKAIDVPHAPLDFWQLFRNGESAETLIYTAGTNSTKGGVYCYSDAERTTASYQIGTVASGEADAALGIAFTNDLSGSVGAPSVSFTTVQRNFKANPSTYVFEWLVTDGAWSIGTESAAWRPVEIPATAPWTAATAAGRTEYRQEVSVGASSLPASLAPGQVLLLRWRHEKLSSGPMMGLDDVRVVFPMPKPGFGVIIR